MKVLDYDKLISVSFNNKMRISIINTIFMRIFMIFMIIIIFNLYTIYNYTDNVNHKYSDKNIEKDFNILLKCYKNMEYINYMNYKKSDKTIHFYYKYFNIGNFALTNEEVQHPSKINSYILNKNEKKYDNIKNKLTKFQPCLYIMKSMELSYKKYDIFNNYQN
tara:strand:- start:47 stop:535 length:489 start_codon:yes stop_codon:yes gene_type:complete